MRSGSSTYPSLPTPRQSCRCRLRRHPRWRRLDGASGDTQLIACRAGPSTTGRWLTLHATWLTAPGEGRERQIAVVLETSPPAQVWPLVSAAHQLSPREGDVTLLVARGLSTSEIGQPLRVTGPTVQDHLKAVFDMFGVHGRGQLLAAIFGSHYLPRMKDPGHSRLASST